MSEDFCKCKHPFSAHTRNIHEVPGSMKVDEALLWNKEKRGDIFSGKAEGESGCTMCDCRQYIPAGYAAHG